MQLTTLGQTYFRSICVAALFVCPLSGCSPPGESESKMTSFTATESKADTAELFTVPKEQTGRICKSFPRRRRHFRALCAWRARSPTTRLKLLPYSRRSEARSTKSLSAPGQFVKAGQTLLTVTSPDYSVRALRLHQSSHRLPLLAINSITARKISTHTAPSQRQTCSRRNPIACRLTQTWNLPQTPFTLSASRDPEALLKNTVHPTAEIPVLAPVTGEIVERLVGPGQLLQTGATQCFTISNTNTVWVLVNVYQNDLPYVHIGDAVEINTDAYPETFPRKNLLHRSCPGSKHHEPYRRASSRRIPVKKLKKDMYVTALVQGRLHSRRHHPPGLRRFCATRKTSLSSTCRQ